MAIQPTQPQSIGGVLDTTFQLYKASIARVLPLCVLLAIAGSPPSIYMLMQDGPSPADPFGTLTAMQSPTYWLFYLFSVLAIMWIFASLYLKIAAIGAGEDLALGPALRKGLPSMLVLLLTMLLFSIAVAIGTVLLVIPGIILMISLMLSFNLVLFEGKGPIAALTGSHRLVWGNWWRTAAVLTVGLFIVIVIYLLAGMVLGIAVPLVGLTSEDPFTTAMLIALALNWLMSLLLTPFYVGMVIAIYWDLKLRKEGSDLAARVGALNPA